MARLTLTSHHAIHDLILDRDRERGYANCDAFCEQGIHVACHRKKRRPVQNCLRLANNDFAACAGTFIYRERMGQSALDAVYRDFKGDVEAIRRNAIGAYFVAIKQGPRIFMFVDKYETLQAYYYRKGSEWLVTNSLSAAAVAVQQTGGSLRPDEYPLMAEAFLYGVPGNKTVFQDILRLTGNECIVIHIPSSRLSILPVKLTWEDWDTTSRSTDALADEFASLVKDKLRLLNNAFDGDVCISMTGGLDTRTVLSGLIAVGGRPSLAYGVGDSPLTNTKSPDLAIVRTYAERFGLDLHIMDWASSSNDPVADLDKAFDAYGFNALVYNGSRGFFSELENSVLGAHRCLLAGYLGEIVRGRAWIQTWDSETFTIQQFVDSFYVPRLIDSEVLREIYPAYDGFSRWLQEQFLSLVKRFGIVDDAGRYRRMAFPFLYDPWFRRPQTAYSSLVNRHTSMLHLLACPDLRERALRIPVDANRNEAFILRVLMRLEPRMLRIPFFSHTKRLTFNPKRVELRRPFVESLLFFLVRSVVQLLKDGGALGRILHGPVAAVYRLAQSPFKDQKGSHEAVLADGLTRTFRELVLQEQELMGLRVVNPVPYRGEVRNLARYAQLLHYVRKVGEA